ncbi:MAG TPA: SLC13 family permease [Gemmatimonadetes bacterium]|nr:SLC13 family permease [Gemmatimonadota bacterium]HAC07310.1 SLC13 family permease [Gemmatimonadota bacterium]HBD96680.1 SLC13 family permease [Gemmatimonadota bacterium]HIN52044.1 sodium-coupled transporter [Gemmatimonadota bacterium]
MTLEIGFVLLLTIAAVVLFVTEKFSTDIVAILVMVVLLVSRVLTPAEGLAGFANTATVTVGAMFVLSAGMFRSGAVNFVGRGLGRLARHSSGLMLFVLMVGVGVLSSFLNNTAAVAILIPVVIVVARRADTSPSKLLMPLSFASMFGGMCTVLGTSTNILASAISEQAGLGAFGMFEFTKLGVIFFAVGVTYMMTVGRKLVPDHRGRGDLTTSFGLGDYLTDLILQAGSKSVGRPLASAPLVKDLGIEVLQIRRGEDTLRPTPETILCENDVLRIQGNLRTINELKDRAGVAFGMSVKWRDEDLQSTDTRLVEAVVGPSSPLAGKSLAESHLRENFGAWVLAVRQHGTLRHSEFENITLMPGDTLLIDVPNDQIEHLTEQRVFLVVSRAGIPRFNWPKAAKALAIVVSVVVVAATGLLPIVAAAATGALAMVLSRCISTDEAYGAIEWNVLFLLAGMLSLGAAMEKTGASTMLAEGMVNAVGGFGPIALLAAFFGATMLLTEVMSNNATVALLLPIAITTAHSIDANPRTFMFAVVFAASSSFMTPVGYQTNTMIYGPGQYRFVDFVRVGAPLNLIFWILGVLLIPWFWPL